MTQIPAAERPTVIQAGLIAAGVPAEHVQTLAPLTDELIMTESGWNPQACALAHDSSYRGPAALFGDDPAKVMPDGRSYATPRGLAQLTTAMFEQYRAAGTSEDIYDPVASIAALWRFIADRFAVDLHSGEGVSEFRQQWFDHRPDWWWLTALAPFSTAPPVPPGY